MSGELVYEIFGDGIDNANPVVAPSWVRVSFTETAGPVSGGGTVELAPRTPPAGCGTTVRSWRRDGTVDGDAQIIASWLHHNALSARLGVATDMLVYLFIEAAVHHRRGRYGCDGEFLATIAGAAEYIGTTADSEWSLVLNLPPVVVAAALDAVADSGPRWRYAVVAARDPESPAGRVRQRLLADLDG